MLGDAFGAGIVHHLSRADLKKMDDEDIEIDAFNEKGNEKSAEAVKVHSKKEEAGVKDENGAPPSETGNGYVNTIFDEKM